MGKLSARMSSLPLYSVYKSAPHAYTLCTHQFLVRMLSIRIKVSYTHKFTNIFNNFTVPKKTKIKKMVIVGYKWSAPNKKKFGPNLTKICPQN